MQMYRSPGGTRYIVFRGYVFYKPNGAPENSPVLQSNMTVARFLELIEGGLMTFVKTVNPALAYAPEHWNSTNS